MTDDNTYTTGELADLCGVTVRSIQHYDHKGLLVPSSYSEGGRRLYDQDDLSRLRFILLLKSLGLQLAQIKGILDSSNSQEILSMFLEERKRHLEEELKQYDEMVKAIELVQSDLKLYGEILTPTQTAMDVRMNDRKALTHWRIIMVIVGLCMDIAWIGTLVYGIVTGVWWPFPLALILVAVAGIVLVRRTGEHTTYICPVCKAEFRPKLGAFFIANHTPTTRKLRCPCCGLKDWCIERYYAAKLKIAPGTCIPGTCKEGSCEGAYRDQ